MGPVHDVMARHSSRAPRLLRIEIKVFHFDHIATPSIQRKRLICINLVVFNNRPTACFHRSVLRRQIMQTPGISFRSALLLTAITTVVGAQLAGEKVMFWRSKPQEMHSAESVPASGDGPSFGWSQRKFEDVHPGQTPGPPVQSRGGFSGSCRLDPAEARRPVECRSPGPEQDSRRGSRYPDPALPFQGFDHAGTRRAGRGTFS